MERAEALKPDAPREEDHGNDFMKTYSKGYAGKMATGYVTQGATWILNFRRKKKTIPRRVGKTCGA